MEIKKSFTKTIFCVIFAVIFAVISFFAFSPLNKAKSLQVDFNSDLRTDVQTESFFGSDFLLNSVSYWHNVGTPDWAGEYSDDGATAYLTNLIRCSCQFTYEDIGRGYHYYFSFSEFSIPLAINTDDGSEYGNLDTVFVKNSGSASQTAYNTTGIVFQKTQSAIRGNYGAVGNYIPYQYIELPDNVSTVTTPLLVGRNRYNAIATAEIGWVYPLFLQVFDSNGFSAWIEIYINFTNGLLDSTTTYRVTNSFIGCTIGRHMTSSNNVNYVGIQYLTESDDYSMPYIAFKTNLTLPQYAISGIQKRTYYFSADKSGYTNGYNDGIEVGIEQGFSQGEQQGYTNGYANGHTAGVSEANTYSFTGLISAVIDAPIKAITGLFDFTIFGVNFKNFALAILTFSIILVCVRLLMKGGK